MEQIGIISGPLRNGNPRGDPSAAPRCTAHSKRTGLACRQPAKRGCRVCRFHGAGGGAPRGKAHGRYRYGCRTIAYAELLARARWATRGYRELARLWDAQRRRIVANRRIRALTGC